MPDRITIPLYQPAQAKTALGQQAWPWIKDQLIDGNRLVLELRKDTRSKAQNRLMWSCLTDLSEQVVWFGKKMEPDGWKNFITGHLNGQELHPNMDGTGFISVTRGTSTSGMTKGEMTAVIDLCHAFGADKGVAWSETSIGLNEVNG